MTGVLNFIITINLLLFILYVSVHFKIPSAIKLRFQYFILAFAIILAALQPLIPGNDFMLTKLEVWSGQETFGNISTGSNRNHQSVMTMRTELPSSSVSVSTFSTITLSIFVMIFFTSLILILKELLLLRRIRRSSYVLRSLGKVQLLVSDSTSSPYSYWVPGKYRCVFPSSLVLNPKDLQIALAHELQHHRQLDTVMAPFILFFRFFFFYNPFAHLWAKKLNELQEFACDEAVLQHKNISFTDYLGCLIRAAETMVSSKNVPVCAAGLILNKKPNILKRRILMMNASKKSSRPLMVVMIATITAVMCWTSYASRGLVKDRRITLADAQRMADKANETSELKLPVNEEILKELNHFLGTPEGREYFKVSLERKASYTESLKEASQRFGTPDELNAIPIVESGYKNILSRSSAKSGGIWMFIPATARRFGMQVNGKLDERLNVKQETLAAHKYLLSNKLIFNDWLLGIFAFNVGERAVLSGIQKYDTRDVWELSKHIHGDTNYMQRVVAAMIIMRNPEVLEQ